MTISGTLEEEEEEEVVEAANAVEAAKTEAKPREENFMVIGESLFVFFSFEL